MYFPYISIYFSVCVGVRALSNNFIYILSSVIHELLRELKFISHSFLKKIHFDGSFYQNLIDVASEKYLTFQPRENGFKN